jgi:nicotinamide-nucleotide amidase
LPNPNGSAPGWLVRARDGRVIVALPGPPREMSPMWRDEAVPRLEAIGLGTETAARTFRLHGIGESHAAELLGEALLRAPDPQVATYARTEAVDVRVSSEGPGAADRVAAAAAIVEDRLGPYVWATGDAGWADAVGAELAARGWTIGFTEMGLGGALAALLGGMEAVRRAEIVASPAESGEGVDLAALAIIARDTAAADVGLAAWARPRGQDTGVSVAVVTPAGMREDRRVAFLGGPTGRTRAAHAAASVLLGALREANQP